MHINLSHLQTFFYLIDLNDDGKIFSDELFAFFNKFYEETHFEEKRTHLDPEKLDKIFLHFLKEN
jgi:hypothetical protein